MQHIRDWERIVRADALNNLRLIRTRGGRFFVQMRHGADFLHGHPTTRREAEAHFDRVLSHGSYTVEDYDGRHDYAVSK